MTQPSAWFVYMILASDNQLYTGITTNISRRWREHSSGRAGAKYFRGRAPIAIALLEAAPDRACASRREAALKRLTRNAKLALLQAQHGQTQQQLSQTDACLPALDTNALHQLLPQTL